MTNVKQPWARGGPFALLATGFVLLASGCGSVGSPPNIKVYAYPNTEAIRCEKLEVTDEQGRVVFVADADEDGNGRVTILDGEGNVLATIPKSTETGSNG